MFRASDAHPKAGACLWGTIAAWMAPVATMIAATKRQCRSLIPLGAFAGTRLAVLETTYNPDRTHQSIFTGDIR